MVATATHRRRLRRHLRRGLLTALALLAAACRSTGAPPALTVQPLYSSAHCNSPSTEAAAVWIDERAALIAVFQRIRGHILDDAVVPPEVNFERAAVLLIEMGRRNTGGYGLQLVDRYPDIVGERARVRVAWNRPAEDVMVPQVLTSPCLMLEIPRGRYSSVQVIDQAGRVRVTVPVEPPKRR